jgi:hypothetical protein
VELEVEVEVKADRKWKWGDIGDIVRKHA